MFKSVLLVIAYIATARMGLSLAAFSGFATLIWIPTGISFAALYLMGKKYAPAIFIGAAVSNFFSGADAQTALLIATGNTLEAWIGVTLFTQFAGKDSKLDSVRDVTALVTWGALVSTLVSATIGVAALHFGGIVKEGAIVQTWGAWWIGDIMSNLVIAPIFLVWRSPREKIGRARTVEGVVLSALVIGIVLALFTEFPKEDLHLIIRPQWIFIFLIWGTLRFSQHANVMMSFFLSAIAITGTMLGYGPYTGQSIGENLVVLQLFSIGVALSGLFFGALGREKEAALRIRTDFISIASHELRTPITGINISLDVLREQIKENGEEGKYDQALHSLDRQSKKLTVLVDSLLNVARLESGNLVLEKQDTDISNLVTDVSKNLNELFQRTNCSLKLNVQPSVHGKCSAYGMEQVLTNLIMNSLKYGAGKPVTIELIEKNNKAFLSVKDSGMGIPLDHQQKIFDRYYRVNDRPDANSLGLGLYITRLIVDAHHGKISVESEEGKGSTFTVEIPFA